MAKEESHCIDCPEWCGRCRKDKVNRIAWSEACQEFSDVVGKFSSEVIMFPLVMEKVKVHG